MEGLKAVIAVIAYVLMIVAFGAALVFLYDAVTLPYRFNLFDASAIQITQVYSEATYNAVMVVALMVVALFGLVAGNQVVNARQVGQTGA